MRKRSTCLIPVLALVGGFATEAGVAMAAGGHAFPFTRERLGLLPEGLTKPVPNGLALSLAGSTIVLEGDTGKTAEYQLISSPHAVAAGTAAVGLSVKGEILAGGLYVALLDDAGRFLGTPLSAGVGKFELALGPVPVGRNLTVSTVLGNGARGESSRWRLTAIAIEELTAAEFEERERSRENLRFDEEFLGGLPPGLQRTAGNSLRLVKEGGEVVLEGETSAVDQYQLQSHPIRVRRDAVVLKLVVRGEVRGGGLVYGLLGEDGRFLGPSRNRTQGPIGDGDIVVSPGGNRFVRVVLSNPAPGSASRWLLWRIGLEQLSEAECPGIRKCLFVGWSFEESAWVWAWKVLGGAPPASLRADEKAACECRKESGPERRPRASGPLRR